MTGEFTMAGWEIIHGGEWLIHRELEPGIVSAIEGRRFSHFTGAESLWSDTWNLDYHFTPGIRFRAEDSRWQVRRPETWHLYPPGVHFYQDTRKSTLPLHAIWIRFHGAEKLGLGKVIDGNHQFAAFHDPDRWLMDKIRSFTLARDTHGESSYTDVAVGLMEIIRKLMQSPAEEPGLYRIETDGQIRPRDALAEKTDEYLVAHLHESVTLNRMATELHTSVPTLKRRYKAASGHSVRQALIRLRIVRVKRLLLEGATIGEAADRTGFFDAFHLSKTFKRVEGVAPRQFVARMRQG